MSGDIRYPVLTQLCRLCLKEDVATIDIFAANENNEKSKQLSVPMRIMACAGLEVQMGDGLPRCICNECRYQLEKSFYFRKRAILSDSKVRKHVRLLHLGKKSRVFAKDEDADEDELEFEDSLEFIKNQDELRNQVLIKNQEKMRLEWQQELEEVKKSQMSNMHKEVRERCSQLKKELWHEAKRRARIELEEEIREQVRSECIESAKEELLDQFREELLSDLENYLHGKREECRRTSTEMQPAPAKNTANAKSQQKNLIIKDMTNTQKSLKRTNHTTESNIQTRLRSRLEASGNEKDTSKQLKSTPYEIVATSIETIEKINDENTNDDEETAQANFYIVEDNSEVETLVASDDLEYPILTDVNGGNTALYQIEANGEIQTINKSNNEVLYFKMDEEVEDVEQLNMVEFVNLKREKSSKNTTSTATYVTTNSYNDLGKVPGFTKIIKTEAKRNISDDEKKIPFRRPTDTPKSFKCDLCPMSFSTANTLNRHYRIHERSEKNGKTFECDECHVIFSCKSALTRHAIIHTGERPYKCKECGKSFVQREILKRHQQVHTGERPYRCPHCPRAYTQKVNLQQHINHNHSKIPMLHACHLCPKSFNHASGLSRHLATHSGVSYQCMECERSFGDRSSVKRHVLHVHMSADANDDNANKFIKECLS